MSTPLTDSINALTAYANDVTGGSDTNLSDAVHTLASRFVKTGSFIPTKTSVNYVLDIGITGWTHLLIIPRVYPYEVGQLRCIGLKYINLNTMRMITAFGSSSNDAVVASTGSTKIVNTDSEISVNDGIITFGGVQSVVGLFVADCVYDWYAW